MAVATSVRLHGRVSATSTTDQVTISRLDADDTAGIEERYLLHRAAYDVDLPMDPLSRTAVTSELAFAFPGATRAFVLGRLDGVVVASGELGLPTLDNTDNATLDVVVHPAHRRRGIGRQMLDHLVAGARAADRVRVLAEVRLGGTDEAGQQSPGAAFAATAGASPALVDVRRRLDVAALDVDVLGRLLADTEAHSSGYRVVRWSMVAPDALVDGLVALESRMTIDPPMGELAWEPEHHDTARWRATEVAAIGRSRTSYGAAVIHSETGEVAGYTMCAVDVDVPEHAWQWATIVLPAHRGHRLGLRLKADMLAFLRREHPEVRTFDTWNAAENTHMIAVNEVLGFRPLDRWAEMQLDLV